MAQRVWVVIQRTPNGRLWPLEVYRSEEAALAHVGRRSDLFALAYVPERQKRRAKR